MSNLQLGVIGNSCVGALINEVGCMLWACLPRFDGDPVFCALLSGHTQPDGRGSFRVQLAGLVRSEQEYLPNTAILVTRLFDENGGAVEITDFAPRFRQFGRPFHPAQFVRTIRPIAGSPSVRIALRPAAEYGRSQPSITSGSNHVRFVGTDSVLRVTTDCSITAVLEEMPFVLRDPVNFVLGPDETLTEPVAEVARRFREHTADYWHDWVRDLAISFEWQDAIIRAAITLKLAAYDDTGAIVAALTTSIPESENSGRNWDYRYCWLRDAYFVVAVLNRLNATRMMERYIRYIINIAARGNGELQPVYRIGGGTVLEEHVLDWVPGYRGMGPVRVGNQAYRQVQNDVYGAAILAATHAFFDTRQSALGNEALFRRLEILGHRATALHATPDAGPWELRGSSHVHTFSSVMCWVACDRLARIARRLALADAATQWQGQASAIHAVICERAWSAARQTFVSTFDGNDLDATLLLLVELGFLRADDPRFAATVAAVERELKHGDFIYRYVVPDDFGAPRSAFLVCTFWYIDALTDLGRRDEARALFEKMLARRNRLGLLSEDIDPASGELWGNFPQTYSLVGLINCAMKLSVPWSEAY